MKHFESKCLPLEGAIEVADEKPDLEKARDLLVKAEVEATVGERNDDTLRDVADALNLDLSQNANSHVPWTDPLIPFECGCGAIIYSDSVHEC